MRIRRRLAATAAATALLAAAGTVVTATAASAHRIPHVVDVTDSATGVLTTTSPLIPGDVLVQFGGPLPSEGAFAVVKVVPVVINGAAENKLVLSGPLDPRLRGTVVAFRIRSLPAAS